MNGEQGLDRIAGQGQISGSASTESLYSRVARDIEQATEAMDRCANITDNVDRRLNGNAPQCGAEAIAKDTPEPNGYMENLRALTRRMLVAADVLEQQVSQLDQRTTTA